MVTIENHRKTLDATAHLRHSYIEPDYPESEGIRKGSMFVPGKQPTGTCGLEHFMGKPNDAANDRLLIEFLRREARWSGVWFTEQLARAADRLEALATSHEPTDEMIEAGAEAYASAVAHAASERRRINDEIHVPAGRERIAPENVSFPGDWLGAVYTAMHAARNGGSI